MTAQITNEGGLVVSDNSKLNDTELSEIPLLKEKLLGKKLRNLQDEGILVYPKIVADAEDLDKDQEVLRYFGGGIWTGNVMGFIGCEDERLIISSRFSGSDDKNSHSDHFLYYLLCKVVGAPNVVSLETSSSFEEQLFEFLTLLFPPFLQQALGKGMYKTYVRREYNDANVRGPIDVARHIALNTPFVGRVAYSRREHSYDNEVTQLIRHTIEYMKRSKVGRGLLSHVQTEVRLIVDSTPSYRPQDLNKVIFSNKKKPVTNALYSDYRELQRLCTMILQRQRNNIGSGSQKMYGILFDGAWLWEEYLNTLVGEWFYHPQNKAKKGKQILLAPLKKNSKKSDEQAIYPDFIGKKQAGRVIADAKYKPYKNIDLSDYYQVLSYMFRFNAKRGFYFYPKGPKDAGSNDEKLFLCRGTSYEKNVSKRMGVWLMKLGLEIPQSCTTFEEFKEQMEESEHKFEVQLKEHAGFKG